VNFTFGIVTGGSHNHREYWDKSIKKYISDETIIANRINSIIDSIENQNIPNFEIIIVGGKNYYKNRKNVIHINFNELIKPGWLTKKKNIIIENSKYENIVTMHDYIILNEGWYQGFLKFGNDWDVCMNVVNNIEDGRWIDWLDRHPCGHHVLIPYENTTKSMYVNGAYWVAKRQHMLKYKHNESLLWGQADDIEWSDRWFKKGIYKYKMNTLSSVKCCKEGKIYSTPFLYRSQCESAFKTSDINKIKKWYINTIGTMNPPWIIDDINIT
jgi:hypothetical protein